MVVVGGFFHSALFLCCRSDGSVPQLQSVLLPWGRQSCSLPSAPPRSPECCAGLKLCSYCCAWAELMCVTPVLSLSVPHSRSFTSVEALTFICNASVALPRPAPVTCWGSLPRQPSRNQLCWLSPLTLSLERNLGGVCQDERFPWQFSHTSEVPLRKPLKSARCHREEAVLPGALLHCWEGGVALFQRTSIPPQRCRLSRAWG